MLVSSIAPMALVVASQQAFLVDGFGFHGSKVKPIASGRATLQIMAGYLDNLSQQPSEEPPRRNPDGPRSYSPWSQSGWGSKQQVQRQEEEAAQAAEFYEAAAAELQAIENAAQQEKAFSEDLLNQPKLWSQPEDHSWVDDGYGVIKYDRTVQARALLNRLHQESPSPDKFKGALGGTSAGNMPEDAPQAFQPNNDQTMETQGYAPPPAQEQPNMSPEERDGAQTAASYHDSWPWNGGMQRPPGAEEMPASPPPQQAQQQAYQQAPQASSSQTPWYANQSHRRQPYKDGDFFGPGILESSDEPETNAMPPPFDDQQYYQHTTEGVQDPSQQMPRKEPVADMAHLPDWVQKSMKNPSMAATPPPQQGQELPESQQQMFIEPPNVELARQAAEKEQEMAAEKAKERKERDKREQEFLTTVMSKIDKLEEKLVLAVNRNLELKTEAEAVTAAAAALSSELEDKNTFETDLQSYSEELKKGWDEARELNLKLDESLTQVSEERDELMLQLEAVRLELKGESSGDVVSTESADRRIESLEAALAHALDKEKKASEELALSAQEVALKADEIQKVHKALEFVKSSEQTTKEKLAAVRSDLKKSRIENKELAKELAETVLLLEAKTLELDQTAADLEEVRANESVMTEKVSVLEKELEEEIKKGFKLSRELSKAKEGIMAEDDNHTDHHDGPSGGAALQADQQILSSPDISKQVHAEEKERVIPMLSPFEKARMAFLGKGGAAPARDPFATATAVKTTIAPPVKMYTGATTFAEPFDARLREAHHSNQSLKDNLEEALHKIKEMETLIQQLTANESILQEKVDTLEKELNEYSLQLEKKTIKLESMMAHEVEMTETIAMGQKREAELGRKLEFFKAKLRDEILEKEMLEAEVSRLHVKCASMEDKLAVQAVVPKGSSSAGDMELMGSALPPGSARIVFGLLNVALVGWLVSSSAFESSGLLSLHTL